ncbi:MAG TPA: Maf family protein [Peptococcaceae bacterium]|jgi:septum formation protein|nr:septum formation inhibitor Maf [Clostridia bacterium]HOB82244.1 Maf family protein [Peptococcaceae bacterium]HPZ70973.1 Maf family protein [Peptococcaceae bacterium]HQD54145.1 Maf family protein [Peptococcaceae bacterium]
MELILASRSPRRAELLRQIGLEFRIVESSIKEEGARTPYDQWVRQLALKKAEAAQKEIAQTPALPGGQVILAADTIVVKDGQLLGKPKDTDDAARMLAFLSGAVHAVMTGVCVLRQQADELRFFQEVEITKVHFRSLTEEEIAAYLASGEPFDKAGAYGIQGLGGLLVERIEGCYYNVVGLPLVKTMQLLRKCGIKILGSIR